MLGNTFFYGVVESRADPLKLGRCKVRVIGVHTENTAVLPTKDLPWCVPMQPITSAGVSGIGVSPTGPVEGTFVVVIFRDEGTFQEPLMIGTLSGIPESKDQNLKDRNSGTAGTRYDGVRDIVGIDVEEGDDSSSDGQGDNQTSTGIENSTFGGGNVLRQVEGEGNRKQTQKQKQFSLGEYTSGSIKTPASAVSDGDATSGKTYGKYSLPSYMTENGPTTNRAANSPALRFVRQEYPEEFKGLVPASRQFDTQWQKQAANDPVGFERKQREFHAQDTVTPVVNDMRSSGVDLSDRGPAVQELVFNTVSEYGSAYPITRALDGKEVALMSDAEIIRAVQDSKIKHLDDDFKKKSIEERNLIKSKATADKAALTDLAGDDGKLTEDEVKAIKRKAREGQAIPASGVTEPVTIASNDRSGFQDPFDLYPRKKWLNEQDTSRLARNEKTDQTILRAKEATLIKGVGTAGGGSWDEPKSPYNAKYPLNHVYQSESGHVQEWDDSPNAERIHVYHRAGSFTEYHPDGTVVFKSVKDQFEITVKDRNIYVGGNCNITVKGDANIYSQGSLNMESDGDMTIKTGANLYIGAEGKAEIVSNADLHLGSNGNLHEGAKNIMMNCSWFPQNVTAGDYAIGKIRVEVFDDDENVPTVEALDEESAYHKAVETGAITYDKATAPIKSSSGEMISQTKPDPDIADLKPKAADTKEVKCHGDDALGSDPLSTNYKLADLTTSPVLSKVKLKAQAGLTKCQIFDNLSALAKNVLEPIRARYGNNFIITSAFRDVGSNARSQHPKGQAVDIQFPQLPAEQYVHRAEEISRILPSGYDQLIIEYHGRNPVIHISYNKEGNRNQKKSTPDLRTYFSGFRDKQMGKVYE